MGTPERAPRATTRRQPAEHSRSLLVNQGSSMRLAKLGFLSYASLMLPRNTLRMMQPPRHMSAMFPYCKFHLYSTAACFSNMKPCIAKVSATSHTPSQVAVHLGVRDDLGGQQGVADVLLQGGGGGRDVGGARKDLRRFPTRTCHAAAQQHSPTCLTHLRSSTKEDTQRANTASLTRVSGTPRSAAFMLVHLPVPFWPAASRM